MCQGNTMQRPNYMTGQTKPMGYANDMRIPGQEKSTQYSVNMTPTPPAMVPHSVPTQAAFQTPQAPVDPRVAFQQRFGQQAQSPLSGAYNYDPLSSSQVAQNQEKAGNYPGATPPPGWTPPPPGPFANWTSPLLASMIGRAGAAPPGMNAVNVANGQWGNIDWFPGIPRG